MDLQAALQKLTGGRKTKSKKGGSNGLDVLSNLNKQQDGGQGEGENKEEENQGENQVVSPDAVALEGNQGEVAPEAVAPEAVASKEQVEEAVEGGKRKSKKGGKSNKSKKGGKSNKSKKGGKKSRKNRRSKSRK
jgi:hypothetical protein